MPCRSEEYKVVCALAELCGADVRHGPTGAEQAFGIFLPRAIIFAPDQLLEFVNKIEDRIRCEGFSKAPETL